MDLLVLGGTQFLGRHVVGAALERGASVTVFHRGQTNPGLFDGTGVTEVLGDRDGGLDVLGGRSWDAVVDTCGYVPRVVRDAATALAERVGHYTFVSSVSVYADMATAIDEGSPTGTLEDPTTESVDNTTYGPLKVRCEEAAQEVLPGRVLVVRPGLIVGPFDPTDRFTYWPVRMASGGAVVAPDRKAAPVQIIDGRDLAAWMVDLAARQVAGTFNAVGPNEPLTLAAMLDACRAATGSDAEVTWVDEQVLLDAGVTPWSGLPCWLPASAGHDGMQRVSTEKAAASGLTHRSVETIAADTLAWHRTRQGPTLQHTLSAEKEASLLANLRQ
jgi:2'-hydroxyisoflavone reductase